MATVVLPTRTDGSQRYSFRVSLGGSTFAFEFFWNVRDKSWSFTLSDSSGNLLLSRKITVNTPLLWRSLYVAGMPLGELVAVDSSKQAADPGLADLGSRVLLTFTDLADLP